MRRVKRHGQPGRRSAQMAPLHVTGVPRQPTHLNTSTLCTERPQLGGRGGAVAGFMRGFYWRVDTQPMNRAVVVTSRRPNAPEGAS